MRLFKVLFLTMIAAALIVEPVVDAQNKTTKTQAKTTTTQNTTTAQKKTATTQAKKTTTTSTAKKPATTQQKKPAQKPQSKPQSKSQSKPQSKQQQSSQPAKRLSRAEYEKQQKDLIKQIAATERMISDNDKSVLSLDKDIKLREDEIGKRRALLVSMQLEIESIRLEEDSLRKTIGRLKEAYQGKQDKYAAAVRHIYKWRSGYDEWLFVFSANDLGESLRRIRYLRQYSGWRKQEAHQLAQQRMATESVQEKLSLVRLDREAVMGNLQKERDALTRKQEAQESARKKLQSKQRELKAALTRDQKKQREIQNMITKLIEEERRKAAKQSSGGSQSSGKSSGGNQYYTPAEVEQLTGSFRQNKGKMPYPVDSNFAITSHYAKNGNYSIALTTSVGAHACAIFDGTVQRVVKSSEDWTVIITHGEYMSVYSNLSAPHVTEGQKVKMRQSIGKIKEDIDGQRTELMFWIFGKSDAENPELWLKK